MLAARPEQDYLPAITGLRGVAAAWVLLYHAWQFAGGPRISPVGVDLTPLLACGYFGVDLFFVLSGFLLGMPFLTARQRGESVDLRRFWRNRARRVLPAYWAQLLVLLALAVWSGGPEIGSGVLLGHFSLSFNLWQNDSAINPVYWSLPVEWDFYILLPLLALPFRGRRSVLITVLVGVLAVIAFRWLCVAALHWWGADGVPLYRWIIQLPGRLDQFLLGMAAAWCYLNLRTRGRGWLWAGLLVVLLMCWGAASRGDFVSQAQAPWVYGHYTGVGLGFALCILGALAAPRSWLVQRLSGRVLGWLGMISYSLYLWHYPVLSWQRQGWPADWPAWGGVALSLPPVLLLSWLSYRLIERPFLGRRARRAEQATTTTASTPAVS
ncbi:acyltransferase family protein [Pseudomarimonas arenosa]|uniref:Acyltransferase n=1 Tax=Pseudomarimonas arenosa TaxID=2774145 RepID=A0AAW3ZH24_9GAMM|nr:acyltransferase [Pseudomarimonas arenosa]MBD8525113.1 acyltransferase [Pseudomarimonas arenosa]